MHIAAALLAMVIAGANSQLIESQSSSITLTTTNVDSLPAALTVPVQPEMTHVNVQITADIGASPVSQSVSLAGASSVPQLTVTAADIADIGAPPLQQKLITSSSSSVGAGHVEAAQSSPTPSVDAFTQFQLFTQQTAEKFNSSDNSTTSIPMQSTQPAVENSSRTTISTSITHVEPSLFATLQTLASTSIAQSLSSTSTSTSTSTSIPSSASQQGSLSPQITTSMQPIETQVSGSSLGQVLESDIPVPKTPKENNKVPVPPQPQVNNPKTVPSSQNSIAVPSNTTINPLASPITVSPVDGGNKGNDKSKAKSVSQQLPSSPVDHQASLAAAVAIEADGPSITVNPTQEPAPTQPIDTIQKKNVIGGLLRDNSMIDDTADEAGSSDKRQQRAKPLPLVNSYRPGQTGGGEIKNGVKSFSELPRSTEVGKFLLNILPQAVDYNYSAFNELPQGLPIIILRLKQPCGDVCSADPQQRSGSRTLFIEQFTRDLIQGFIAAAAAGFKEITAENIRITNVVEITGDTIVQIVLFPVNDSNVSELVESLFRQFKDPQSKLRTVGTITKMLDDQVFGIDVLLPVRNDNVADTGADSTSTTISASHIVLISIGAYAVVMVIGVLVYKKYLKLKQQSPSRLSTLFAPSEFSLSDENNYDFSLTEPSNNASDFRARQDRIQQLC